MAPGALGNAIADALEPFGVVLRELPFSRERIWRLVAEAKAAPAPGPDGTAGMPRVVRFHSLQRQGLQLDDVPMPKAGEKEIVLRVEAFGPNRAETMFRRGEYPQYAPELPSALGYEASGTVIAVGPGVTSVKVGERVSTIPSFKMAATGPTARSRAFRNTRRRFPAHLSWTEAAAIWMPYMGSKAWTPTSLRLSGPRGCPGCSHREPRYRRLLREAGAPISGARALRERRPASGQLEPFKANQPAPLHQTIFALLLPK
jgi:hypothetical protein